MLLYQAVTYGIVWRFVRNNPQSRPRQFSTRGTLHELRSVILKYREKHEVFPKNLAVPEIEQNSWLTYDGFDPEQGPYDAWGRPFYYEADANSFLIYSLGRDGKVGGAGVDIDLYSHNGQTRSEDREVTWEQFRTTNDDHEISGSGKRTRVVVFGVISVVTFLFFGELFLPLLRKARSASCYNEQRESSLKA